MTDQNDTPTPYEILASDLADAEKDLQAAHECIKTMMSALCWYADPANHQSGDNSEDDNGRRARLALGAVEKVE